MTEQHNADPVWRVAGPHNDVIVEREGVRVGTICECDKQEWKQPELIEIVACPAARKPLPLRVQRQIWNRLLGCLRGDHPMVHDRPEIGRLSETTFRAIMNRAVFELTRDRLLQQPPFELLRWHRLLRLPRNANVRSGVTDFVRALRYAAGLHETTETQ